MIVVQTNVGSATTTAVRSMLVLGASQKPRKITLPVMLATNTWPRTKMLIESAIPVAKVSNNSAATVDRSDTGDVTAMGAGFARPVQRYRCGVKSSEVTVVILVTSQRRVVRFMNSR